MRTLVSTFLVLASATVANAEDAQSTHGFDPDAALAPRGSYQFVEPDLSSPPLSYATDDGEVIIYLNGLGGVFSPGKNDSRANTTSLIDAPRVLPPFSGSAQQWNELVSCVDDQFKSFRVQITTQDPGALPHYEAVISGEPSDLDQGDHIGGISPFRLDCGVISNSVVFVFADIFGEDTPRLCEIVAQEVAHSFGLDHQMNCDDPMSYLGGCGEKRFQNEDAQCGEYEMRECACGDSTQNSKKVLARHLGDVIAPELNVPSPQDGAVVNPVFYVHAAAQDNIAVERVELFVDGELAGSQGIAPYVFEFTGQLEEGRHNLEVKVYDSENVVSKSFSVTVDPDAEMQPPPDVQQLEQMQRRQQTIEGGCNAGGGSGGMPGVLLSLLWYFRRRRPRSSTPS